jgi:hydrogenase maturation protease
MTRDDGPLVVIGIGNLLLGDDGIGVHVVRALGDRAARGEVTLPAGTRLLDGGTLALGLLDEMDGARALVLVDAVDVGAAPGTIVTLRGDALRRAADGYGPPRAGLAGLLATAELAGTLPADVVLVGIQPHRLDVGLAPTDAVRDALPTAVETTLAELRRAAPPDVRAGPAAHAHLVMGAPA